VHKPVPDELSVMVGDIAHNLRSALDQMVAALVRDNRRNVAHGTGFPISESAERFKTAAISKLRNLSAEATKFITDLEPYKGGKTSALWVLAELNNMDKHNTIVPTTVAHVATEAAMSFPFLGFQADGSLTIGVNPPGEKIGGLLPTKRLSHLEDNAIIHISPFADSPFHENVELLTQITLGKTQITNDEPVIEFLAELINFVEGMLNTVERDLIRRR
jgi:hypothetical protein